MPLTIRLTHRYLPHWEVEQGRYFITVRCADSLPAEAIARLGELHFHQTQLIPQSLEFAASQRATFRTLEKSLDAGFGSCPLRQSSAARILAEEFDRLAEWHCTIPHFCIMPNHWHALIVPSPDCTFSLGQIMKRLKGRTAKGIRATAGGSGPLWQREWFDRWVRNENEWARFVSYIRENPVKAGVVSQWQEYGWAR